MRSFFLCPACSKTAYIFCLLGDRPLIKFTSLRQCLFLTTIKCISKELNFKLVARVVNFWNLAIGYHFFSVQCRYFGMAITVCSPKMSIFVISWLQALIFVTLMSREWFRKFKASILFIDKTKRVARHKHSKIRPLYNRWRNQLMLVQSGVS